MFNTLNKISISVNTYFNYPHYLADGIGGQKYANIDFKKLYGVVSYQEDPFV